jgi:DNA-binding transcriptional MerR regulator
MTKATSARLYNLRIGELATRTGRSVHAIRWYEKQGLIPGVMRDAGGRRVYTERHVSWLELIDRLRLTGMSIAQMREFTAMVSKGKTTLAQQQTLLRAHRERVTETIAQWTAALKVLDYKIDFYGEWLSTGQRPGRNPRAVKTSGVNEANSGLRRRA